MKNSKSFKRANGALMQQNKIYTLNKADQSPRDPRRFNLKSLVNTEKSLSKPHEQLLTNRIQIPKCPV